MTFRYRVTIKATGETVHTRTRKAARWIRALWGPGTRFECVQTRRNARKLYLLKCWGPVPGREWKDIQTVHMKVWLSKTLARMFAWHWEKKSKRHTAVFVRGSIYLDSGRRLRRPHSSERIPF